MSGRSIILAGLPLLLGFVIVAAVPANGQEADKADDVEVLTRGPVHEAYADPGVTPSESSPIIPKQPPDPINELPPDQKPEGDNVIWIPGYWVWDDDRSDYIWLSGFWRVPPPDRTWVPGSWRQVDDGWQWTPGFWAAAAQDNLQYLPEPPAPLEAAPSTPAPSADSFFTPGVWVYRDSRYLWRPGAWITYRPGWIWVPAHYAWTPVGWVFVDGYWDYPLRSRGLLFAPVYFAGRPWLRPNWYYTPTYCVYDDFLMGALFLRPRWGGYWFGDYFGPVYHRRGFVAWLDIRFGRGVYDPMFSFYLRFHRENRGWERDLHALYASRYEGNDLPPRTLVQQTTIINNNVTNVTNIRNVTAVTPLAKVDPAVVKLRTVPAAQLAQERKGIERFRNVSLERRKVETQLLAKGPAVIKATDPPRTAKIDIAPATKPVTTVKPPPPPVHAALETKPKDTKPLNIIQNRDTNRPPPVVAPPKKDAPPPPKKDAPPPPKKDAPPPPKKDAPPPPKKDAPPPMPKKDSAPPKKDKESAPPKKDKEKDKKQASLSTPTLHRESAPPRTVRTDAAPTRQETKSSALVQRVANATPPVSHSHETKTSVPPRNEAKAAPAPSPGPVAKAAAPVSSEVKVAAPTRKETKAPAPTHVAKADTKSSASRGHQEEHKK
jgi:hypothetical protein